MVATGIGLFLASSATVPYAQNMHPRRKHPLTLALLVIVALLASPAPSAQAQADFIDQELDEGYFAGTIALSGGFAMDFASAGSTVATDGEVVFLYNGAGPAEIEVDDGQVSGTWSFSGTSSANGTVTAPSYPVAVKITAEGTSTSNGTFGGSPTAPTMSGQYTTTNTATVSVEGVALPVGPQSETVTETQPFTANISNVLAGCYGVVMNFTQELNAQIEASLPNTTAFLRGIITADKITDPEYQARLDDIVTEAANLQNSTGDPLTDVLFAISLLNEIEKLQTEVQNARDCPPDPDFFNALTNVASSVIGRTLERLENDPSALPDSTLAVALRAILRLGTGTGALGSGSGGRGDALMGRARAVADTTFRSSNDADDLTALAAISVQYGWGLVNDAGVSDVDILCANNPNPSC